MHIKAKELQGKLNQIRFICSRMSLYKRFTVRLGKHFASSHPHIFNNHKFFLSSQQLILPQYIHYQRSHVIIKRSLLDRTTCKLNLTNPIIEMST